MNPLMIDLYAGLGGWAYGGLTEGYNVVGFDIEAWSYPAQLVLQDVLTLHGSQFKSASLIVASPPCQEYSYMAMPWSRAKAIAAEYRNGKRDVKKLTALFDACFRIQREASEAAGRHIPMVVENVCGAQPWVGRAKWHYGSYYLWGDVPALMPMTRHLQHDGEKVPSGPRFVIEDRGKPRKMGHAKATKNDEGIKNARNWWSDGLGNLSATTSSHSVARKQASALIAKIPFSLALHIARMYKPAYNPKNLGPQSPVAVRKEEG